MKTALGVIAMMCAGCAAVPPAEAEVPEHGGKGCDASKARSLVGQAATQTVRRKAQRLSGATIVRRIPEGTVVTMEYREDRLNLHLDRRNRIVRIVCG